MNKCKECKYYQYNPIGRFGRGCHKCSLKVQQAREYGLYHNGLMYAREARTRPKWCPLSEDEEK